MELDTVRDIVAALDNGEVRSADPSDLDAAVRSIADGLGRPDWRDEQMRKAMGALNNRRQFTHTRTLGKAWTDLRPFDAEVTRRYAQALIELFELDPAE